MVSVNNLSLYFGGQDIFKDISFMVNKRDKIGLTGKNGAGKSTLLKVLAKDLTPNRGNVSVPNGLIVGFLRQDLEFEDGRTVLEEAQTAFEFLNDVETRMNEANKQLTERTDYESEAYLYIINEFNELEERFRMAGGNDTAAEINQVLSGLGFTQYDFERQTTEFSGGWRMRIELAKILLMKPDLLLLDEPTNHLDIESIQWLERYLKSYAGIILLISHDKQFLDNITNRTIELANGKLYDYKSNYSKYLQLREEEIITQIAAKKNQEKMVKHTQELINKFRAKKNKAAFAQSLIKKLDKLEDIEIDQLEKDRIQFQFPEPSHSGKETLKIAGLEKSYGDKQIFKKVDLSIARGEKIALIGKNGMGKSTFIKSIVKDIEFSGNVQLGHQVMMGYFAQDEAHKLDPKKTVFETIDDVAVGEVRKQIRPILGSFLFSGEDIDKKVQVLSGGEKTRLSLCKLLLQPNNFLILDEPTNHLDMASKEILKDALNSYSGTLLLVSHDRGFLDGLTDRVYFIKDQSIKVYHEPVTQFIESYYGNIDEKTVSKKVEVKSTQNKKFQNQQKSIERKITNLEEKQTGLEFELYETSDADRIKNIQDQLSKIKSEIDKNFELLMSIGN